MTPRSGSSRANSRPSAMRYRATITSGSLKVQESRIVADLLIRGVNGKEWHQAVLEENVLQARSVGTAGRLSRLLRGRLALMRPALWRMVRDGSLALSTHACLAATVKSSVLLGDFLDLVVREQFKMFQPTLSNALWEHYVEECGNRDPDMTAWSETTIARLRSTVFQILAQAGYVDNTRTLRLQTVHIASDVLSYLEAQGEEYVLRCIRVGP